MKVIVDLDRAHRVAPALLVEILEQFLAGNVLAGFDDPREPAVAQLDLLALPGLRPKLEVHGRAIDVDMPVAHRGQAEGAVVAGIFRVADADQRRLEQADRSEEHTSELQSLMRISYAVFCLKN